MTVRHRGARTNHHRRGHEQAMSEQPPTAGGWQLPDQERPWGSPGAPAPSAPPLTPPVPSLPAGGWGAPAPPGGDPQWRPPPKPGVVPLRPLGLGELLDGAVQTMRQNPRVMLGMSAAVMAVAAVLSTGLSIAGLPRLLSAVDTPQSQLDSSQVADLIGGGISGLLLPAALQGLAVVVLSGVLILAVSEAVLGRRPGAGQVWAKARSRIPALIGLSLLTGVLTLLGVAVLLGPGLALLAVSGAAAAVALVIGVPAAVALAVLVYVRLAFAAPALLLEDLGVLAAMRRSWRLVRGSWWRVLGVLLITTIIASVANGLLQAPFSIVGAVIGAALAPDQTDAVASRALVITVVVGNIGTVIASTVTAPFSAAVTALLYIDLRIRREGLDVALARAAGA